ncbi:hypothetical protein F8388_000121 [Cannabis sativa]|uniref:Uncharacterized protein n=1 Tax=Cannabis sativa TaxID=3483 RepID=A0A7J6FMN6_CANSA|nr:hypothetical protein F8388_000121 [Cannabis sativa]
MAIVAHRWVFDLKIGSVSGFLNSFATSQRVSPPEKLAKKEIEEDFISLLGHKPPRRPKKRPRNVQRQLHFSSLKIVEFGGNLVEKIKYFDVILGVYFIVEELVRFRQILQIRLLLLPLCPRILLLLLLFLCPINQSSVIATSFDSNNPVLLASNKLIQSLY